MTIAKIDRLVCEDDWSDLTRFAEMPQINTEPMFEYRRDRLREQLKRHDVDFCILLNPVSLRYAVDYRSYFTAWRSTKSSTT